MPHKGHCEGCGHTHADKMCSACGKAYCDEACQLADRQEHAPLCSFVRDYAFSPHKAREMLAQPPHGRALTPRQRKFFEAVAHRWGQRTQKAGRLVAGGG